MAADYMKFFRDRAAASKGKPRVDRIEAMRAAMWEYQQARRVVPVWVETKDDLADVLNMRPSPGDFEEPMLDACDRGTVNLQATFDRSFPPPDRSEGRFLLGWVWREMRKDEIAKPGELLAMMPKRDRETAMELFGAARVATAIVAADAVSMLKHSA